MDFIRPNPVELEQMLEAEGVTAPYDDWLKSTTDNIAELIKRDPSRYKSYGPYWWRVKDILAQNGVFLGDNFEGDFGPLYGTAHLDITAAILHSNGVMLERGTGSNRYILEDPEGDTFEYVLEDIDMEEAMINMGKNLG